MSTRRESWVATLAALATIALVLQARVLIGGDTFAGRDHLTFALPSRAFLAESLRAGRLPEWWDGVGLGVPFAANPDHSALYPPAWLVALAPVGVGTDLLLVLHLVLAGLGVSALARRLGADPLGGVVAGGTFMASGLVTSTLFQGPKLLTLAWLPWVAWAADRVAAAEGGRARLRAGALVAIFLAAALLAGDPTFALDAGLLGLAVAAARARGGWRGRLTAAATVAAAGAAALILAAVAVAPALALLADSRRAGGIAAEAAGVWSMPPIRVLEWLWPAALGDPLRPERHLARAVAFAARRGSGMGATWALGLYIGLPALAAAGYAVGRGGRGLRALAVVAGAFVLLALGRYTPLYDAFRAVFLPERLVRYPEKHLAAAVAIASALAGVGWSALVEERPGRRALAALGGVAGAWLGAVAAALFVRSTLVVAAERAAAAADLRAPPLDAGAAIDHVLAASVGAALPIVALAAALWLCWRPSRPPWAPLLVAAVAVGHMIGPAWGLLEVVDREVVSTRPALLAEVEVPAAGPRPRLYRPQILPGLRGQGVPGEQALAAFATALPNSATRFGLAYVRGFDQGESGRLERTWNAAATAGERLLDLYDVEYAILPRTVALGASLPVVGTTDAGDVVLARNERRRPRAFVAPRWSWDADDAATLAALFTPDAPFSPASVRLAGAGDAGPAPGGPLPSPPCQVGGARPEEVTLRCTSEDGGWAVLLDAWAPGWSATVDGEPARIERADALVRAVRIGPGAHVVAMRYRAPWLRAGALASLAAWLALAAMWVWSRRPRRTPETVPGGVPGVEARKPAHPSGQARHES